MLTRVRDDFSICIGMTVYMRDGLSNGWCWMVIDAMTILTHIKKKIKCKKIFCSFVESFLRAIILMEWEHVERNPK